MGHGRVAPLCLLSVCLIVKDEEQMLASCLDSVADVADEIIVYDTGSVDRTVEIARAARARDRGLLGRLLRRARNAALEHARGNGSCRSTQTRRCSPIRARSGHCSPIADPKSRHTW